MNVMNEANGLRSQAAVEELQAWVEMSHSSRSTRALRTPLLEPANLDKCEQEIEKVAAPKRGRRSMRCYTCPR
jgi:hypothetical protein